MLKKFDFGKYECNGQPKRNVYFIDPGMIVAVKYRTMGQSDSVILLEGGHKIELGIPANETVAILEGTNSER